LLFAERRLVLLLAALFCFLFGCHGFYSPFHFVDGSCNAVLLQLVECIESIKSDVKKKMTLIAHTTDVRKSLRVIRARIFLRW